VVLFGHWAALVSIFGVSLCALLLARRKGWNWKRSSGLAFGVAFGMVIVYSYAIDVPEASASYTEMSAYYYTSDHIGRSFNLRDGSQGLVWL
jgi:4-amino-4-deoxy-L-arabinose transferase-like glycosyltransferase